MVLGAELPPEHTVELWFACAREFSPAVQETLRATLDDEERLRLAALVRDDDTRTYLLAHGLLRAVLSRYFGPDPRSWRFSAPPPGKPRLEAPPACSLEFNLTHAGGLAVVACSRTLPLGVDIEPLERAGRILALPELFTEEEREGWSDRTATAREREAVWAWAAREAILKASGHGLTAGPGAASVSWRNGVGLGTGPPVASLPVTDPAVTGPAVSGPPVAGPPVAGRRTEWCVQRLLFRFRDRLYPGTLATPAAAGVPAVRAGWMEVAGDEARWRDARSIETGDAVVEITAVPSGDLAAEASHGIPAEASGDFSEDGPGIASAEASRKPRLRPTP